MTLSTIMALLSVILTAIQHVLTSSTVDAPSDGKTARERYEEGKKEIYK